MLIHKTESNIEETEWNEYGTRWEPINADLLWSMIHSYSKITYNLFFIDDANFLGLDRIARRCPIGAHLGHLLRFPGTYCYISIAMPCMSFAPRRWLSVLGLIR